MQPYYERSGIRLYHGDCREVVPSLGEQFAAVVTDPPYGLSFMGRDWDHAVPGVAFWEAFRDAMLPGAHLLAFGGSRTYHRIAVAIEDAGFEIRDTLQWLYGSGFPKSLDVSKAIDKLNGRKFEDRYALGRHIRERREAAGMSRAAVNAWFGYRDGCEHWERQDPSGARVPTLADWRILHDRLGLSDEFLPLVERVEAEREVTGKGTSGKTAIWSEGGMGDFDITAPATDAARDWQGWGTALKPAYEPIILARKPLSGTVAANVLAHGTGALNIDASRVGSGEDRASGGATGKRVDASKGYSGAWSDAKTGRDRPTGGRWPANVLMDDTAAALLDQMSGERRNGGQNATSKGAPGMFGVGAAGGIGATRFAGDTGGASRFFPALPIDDPDTLRFQYQAKSSRRDRTANGTVPNGHPTCKPTALMSWLLTLVTPPDGTVLDPFAGSGTTGVAAAALGIPCVLIEQEAEYLPIIAGRIDHALDARAGAELPLFAGVAD